ncbi:glycosyltransferase [Listeria seeligeri]|uniref:Glycosyltransferase n=3 Tax=Listeria seeligeri TaxID=1640 RepID=A0A7X0X1V7_LISSE|nr:glycosyltransferase [Listeria seeligeri]KKD44987.1 glycosyltransferase [Listeria seeligeri]MBC1486098.1 glycosyltransferase family 2 protein [Listeria seeligeri]MBC1578120.1 glycosyltransferase family 2 protein [Listeria seeligeri]MBC1586521.1 glycosyltransferase family 2 protein [Listeria seeligeri]MBC1593506.1 glycosyltransferase family 2 protein [Listeria seeligeri]
MIKISIIMPIYNAESYIDIAFSSLKKQTLPQNEFEIICVDDKSTDNSLSKLKQLSKTHKNMRVISLHKNSGGPMVPRNKGIKEAKGKYILFLDNDDYLGEETLERFFHQAEKNQSEVIFGKYVGVNGRGVPQSQFKKGNRNRADILADNLVYTLAPHKMFQTNFLKAKKIYFDPNILIGEDQYFVMKAYVNAQTITVLADYDYYYVVSRGDENLSIKESKMDPREICKVVPAVIKGIELSSLHSNYKKSLIRSYIQRFFNDYITGNYNLEYKTISDRQKIFVQVMKDTIICHLDEAMKNELPTKIRYMIDIITENDMEKLVAVRKQMENFSKSQVVNIEDGCINGRFRQVTPKLTYDEIYAVNHLNTTEACLHSVELQDDNYLLDISFEQSLLTKFQTQLRICLKKRDGDAEIWISPTRMLSTERGIYKINTKLFNRACTWDLFIESEINGFRNRKRVGSSRDFNELSVIENPSSNNQSYQTKAYLTKPLSNLSFQVIAK